MIYVIVADSLDPSTWLEVAFTKEKDAEDWLKEHPSNEVVGYRIESVHLL